MAFQAKMAAAIRSGRESCPIGVDTKHYGRVPMFVEVGSLPIGACMAASTSTTWDEMASR